MEMTIARLQKLVGELATENEDIKRYMLKLVQNQTIMAEKLRNWPFIKVTQDTDKKV